MPPGSGRRGTVIIVVLALLGSLSLLGFLIYTISAQEETSAEYFSDTAKEQQDSGGCNAQFNRALRQIILGADFDEYNSALWGGRHSLVPTMLGRDLHPFSGHGINATYADTWQPAKTYVVGQLVRPTRLFAGALDLHYRCTTAGQSGGAEPGWGGTPVNDGAVVWELEPDFLPFIDQNYNDIPDDPINDPPAPANIQDLLAINLSPAAQNAILDLDDPARPFPEPDVDYTYADINNVFLQHEEQVPQGTNDPLDVVVPSFGRPQLLRNVIADPLQWQVDPATVARVLRPHHQHVAYTSEGDNSGLQRFYNAVDHGPFPLATDPDTGEAISINGPFPFPAAVNEGIWSFYGGNAATPIDYGADPDGDGVNEAFYMDLGAPIQETPDGSQTFVPLFAVTVKSLDSVINLNAHGNLAGGVDTDGDNLFDNPLGQLNALGVRQYVSRSNQAVAPSEVNPEWPLVARPVLGGEGGLDSADPADLDAALEQHRLIFRIPAENDQNPVDSVELANMELYRLLSGSGQMVPGSPDPMVDPAVVTDVFAGRWGEDFDRLLNGLQTQNPFDFPFPGTSGDPPLNPFDDNNNSGEGIAFIHPFDYQAGGRYTLAGMFGKTRQLATIENRQFPVYTNYVTQPTLGYLQTDALHGGNVLMQSTSTSGLLINEPTETSVEPVLAAQQTDDDIFGPGDNVLQLSDNDLSNLGNPGRALTLAPYNFRADLVNDRQEQIRKRFTTSGFDLFAYGKQVAYDPTLPGGLADPGQPPQFRTWEYDDSDGDGKGEFPPSFGLAANDPLNPFRPELRELLKFEVREPSQDDFGLLHSLQRKLSINGVLDRNPNNGDLRFRPLMPHPAGLGRDPVVPSITHPEQLAAGNLEQQEWLARFDRQRMARDIFVLLYTLAGGIDTDYTIDNTGEVLHTYGLADPTDDDLREMAQFAANLLDALDDDKIVTVFEYDINLGNGWGLGDDPFSTADDDLAQLTERRVVYGVEAQELAFNEAFVILAKRVKNAVGTPVDHDATEYNDEEHRDFTFIELENVSPNPVTFDNAAWQIAVKPADVVLPSSPITGERRLTITNVQPPVPSGAGGTTPRITIGTIGDPDNVDPMTGALRPSHFRVDPDGIDTNMDGVFEYVSFAPPDPHQLDLDLIVDSLARYRIHEPQAQGQAGDGSQVTVTVADPPGQELLQVNLDPAILDLVNEGDGVTVELQLRRRVNPTRAEPVLFDSDPINHKSQSADNPWVVVDTMRLDLQVFELLETDGAAEIPTRLQELQSTERRQPLFGRDNPDPNVNDYELLLTSPTGNVANTLTQKNQASGAGAYTLWQPHFDRNYTSVMELFNLPLFGPFPDPQTFSPQLTAEQLQALIDNQVTRKLGSRRTPALMWSNPPPPPPPPPPPAPLPDLPVARLVGHDTAGNRFLHPEGKNAALAVTVEDRTDDNRWYRLLALLEVPSRSHQDAASPEVTQIGQIGTVPAPQYFRSPGNIDLNTLRHHEVLAALLDDQEVIRNDELDTSGAAGNKAYLFDLAADPASVGGARRDWWEQFLLARDGLDPITLLTLPGSPAAKPLRSLGFSLNGQRSLEDTIFRHLPKDEDTPKTWLPNTPYALHAVVVPTTPNGFFYSAIQGGASAATEPAWPTNPGDTVVDGTVTWKNQGLLPSVDRRRRLFELGTEAEHDGYPTPPGPPLGENDIIDYDVRHRLLQKVYNNTTNRSNVFAVFITVGFFEAAEVTDPGTGKPVVRIGSQLTGEAFKPCRGFFVIDRSRAFDLVQSEHLPTTHEDPVNPGTFKFTYSFDRSFPWESLVLYRQLLP